MCGLLSLAPQASATQYVMAISARWRRGEGWPPLLPPLLPPPPPRLLEKAQEWRRKRLSLRTLLVLFSQPIITARQDSNTKGLSRSGRGREASRPQGRGRAYSALGLVFDPLQPNNS